MLQFVQDQLKVISPDNTMTTTRVVNPTVINTEENQEKVKVDIDTVSNGKVGELNINPENEEKDEDQKVDQAKIEVKKSKS